MRGELQAILGLVYAIFDGTLSQQHWDEFLLALRDRLDATIAILMIHTSTSGSMPMICQSGSQPEFVAPYYEHYSAMDPFVHLPEGKAVTLHDFVTPELLERSLFFREYLEPRGLTYSVGLDLRDRGRYEARFRISRPRKSGNFSAADLRLCNLLAPFLKSAINIHFELDTVRSERTVYADAMDELTLAAIILDDAGRVIHSNQVAQRILGQRDGLAVVKDMLVLSDRDDFAQYKRIVARTLETSRSGRPALVEVMRVRRASGLPPLGLIVRPSAPGLGSPDRHLGASVAVFVSPDHPEQRDRKISVAVIQKLFGLTSREAAVALRLVNGKTMHETADELGITLNTARTHLREIFSKTRVDRQADLVRVILKSVAVLAGSDDAPSGNQN